MFAVLVGSLVLQGCGKHEIAKPAINCEGDDEKELLIQVTKAHNPPGVIITPYNIITTDMQENIGTVSCQATVKAVWPSFGSSWTRTITYKLQRNKENVLVAFSIYGFP